MHASYFSEVGTIFWSYPGGSVVKNLPAMQEIQVQSLGQEDPLEKEMATCSCLGNPIDGGAWQAPREKLPKATKTTKQNTYTISPGSVSLTESKILN